MTFTQWFQSWAGDGLGWFLSHFSLILLIVLPLMLSVAMIIYLERKLWASFALRRGPNVVGPLGVLQSFADGLKVALQETIIPASANKGLFLIAPIITFTVAQIVWAVIPFSGQMVLANINVGLLYILAASSLGVYGVIIAGWASNSKYPFFSALRAAAQMVSYEVSIGFILIGIVLWADSFNLTTIVETQKAHVLGFLNGFGFNPLLFPLAVMFLISSLAETARAPFDLTEAESELVAGYQTEYSSMAFALYWLGEYANVILMCVLNAVLFWGGYLPPVDWAPLYAVPGFVWLFIKFLIFFFIFAWIKATVPRFRYDQLMRLGWKVFLPISLLWVFLVSGYLMLTRWDRADALNSGTPTAAMLNDLGATSVCSLQDADAKGKEMKTQNVYISRDWRNGPLDIIQVKHPLHIAGTLRFKLERSSGHGGSGRLEWLGQKKSQKLEMGFGDVIYDDGPGSMMFLQDGERRLVGDCIPKSELKA